MTDLEELVQAGREAIDPTLKSNPSQVEELVNRRILLVKKYVETEEMEGIAHLDEAIQVEREVLQLTLGDDEDRAGRLNNLGVLLYSRYLKLREIANLEETLQVLQEAIEKMPEDPLDQVPSKEHTRAFDVLCGSRRESRSGMIANFDVALQDLRGAMRMIQEGHPYRAGQLDKLESRLFIYNRVVEKENLEGQIRMIQEDVDVIPRDHPYRASRLHSLGSVLCERFWNQET